MSNRLDNVLRLYLQAQTFPEVFRIEPIESLKLRFELSDGELGKVASVARLVMVDMPKTVN